MPPPGTGVSSFPTAGALSARVVSRFRSGGPGKHRGHDPRRLLRREHPREPSQSLGSQVENSPCVTGPGARRGETRIARRDPPRDFERPVYSRVLDRRRRPLGAVCRLDAVAIAEHCNLNGVVRQLGPRTRRGRRPLVLRNAPEHGEEFRYSQQLLPSACAGFLISILGHQHVCCRSRHTRTAQARVNGWRSAGGIPRRFRRPGAVSRGGERGGGVQVWRPVRCGSVFGVVADEAGEGVGRLLACAGLMAGSPRAVGRARPPKTRGRGGRFPSWRLRPAASHPRNERLAPDPTGRRKQLSRLPSGTSNPARTHTAGGPSQRRHMSSTSRGLRAREQQIIMDSLSSRARGLRTKSRWSAVPSRTGVSHAPQVPTRHSASA